MMVFAVVVSTCMQQYPASGKVARSTSFRRAFKESPEAQRGNTFDWVLKVLVKCGRVFFKA